MQNEDLISRAAVVKMLHEKRQKTMNSDNDLLRRGDVVKMLRDKAKGFDDSMPACTIATLVTLQCVVDVRCMPAYKEAGDE